MKSRPKFWEEDFEEDDDAVDGSGKNSAKQQPSSFCMFMRKHISGKTINGVRQLGFDRIIDIGFSNGERVVFEIFDGNVIILDSSGKILEAGRKREWSGRDVRVGVAYAMPSNLPPGFVNLPSDEGASRIHELLQSSEMNSLEDFLSRNAGMGELLAKEAMHRAVVAASAGMEVIKAVLTIAVECEDNIRNNIAYSYGKIVLPLKLETVPATAAPEGFFESLFNERFQSTGGKNVTGKKDVRAEERESLRKRIVQQEALAGEFEANAKESAVLGQLVLANAGVIEEAIHKVRTDGWDAASECDGVVVADKHNGKIVMELDSG